MMKKFLVLFPVLAMVTSFVFAQPEPPENIKVREDVIVQVKTDHQGKATAKAFTIEELLRIKAHLQTKLAKVDELIALFE